MKAIGKYKLLEEMGKGALGTTYLACDTFRNRELAVKVLDPAITGSVELREQLCRDLGAAADLQHPHIVKAIDLGEVDGAIYIATEFLNGSDLRHLERRAFTLAEKLELIVQVCGGLSYAHTKGMPHGNIKPGNIFVTGKDAVILDFGIGKCVASIVASGGRPEGLVPDYFAPEQILGKPFKARSDIFSTAVVLYELLSGKHPFPGGAGLSPREIVHTVPEPLRSLDPQIPEELEQLINRAFEKDPERRLERADEFGAGLYLIAQKLRVSGASVAVPSVPAASVPEPETVVMHAPAAPLPAVLVPEPAPVAMHAPAAFLPADPTPEPATIVSHATPLPLPAVAAVPDNTAFAMPTAPAKVAPNAAHTLENPVPNPVLNPVPNASPNPARQVTPAVAAAPKEAPAPLKLKRAAPPAKSGKMRKRWLPYVAAAVLTFCIASIFFSRQSIRASQSKAPVPAAVESASAPSESTPKVTPPVAAAAPQAAAPDAPAPPATATVSEPAAPKPSEEQVQMVQVRGLWAAGKYGQALELVNDLLAAHPDNMEGRVWKKKIRSAQEAEAAMK